MPEENNIENEIKELISEEMAKNKPEIQRVYVENFPEETEKPEIEKVEVTNLGDIKFPAYPEPKAPIVNIETTEVKVEKTDLTELATLMQKQADLLSRIAEKEQAGIDYEKLDALLAKNKTTVTGHGGISSKRTILDTTGKAINPAEMGKVSSLNSSTTALDNSEVFTGEWEDVSKYGSVMVAVATDVKGSYSIQFSTDGTNIDSTLMRYHKDNEIHAPHRFTVTRKYFRVVYTNNSGSNQSYFRLQTLLGDRQPLNAPLDGTLAQDFDAIATRPTDYNTEVALGLRQGASLWNKFGYNDDVDIGTEIVAAFGGTFSVNTTASTLTLVSTSTDDDSGGTGLNSVVIYGVDANWDPQVEVVTLDGTTNVVTTTQWIGINRVGMYLCGTGQINAGTITITATTGGRTMATIPVGGGVTQQCLYYVAQDHQYIMEWLWANAVKPAGLNPIVTIKVWVYSAVNNGKQEVYRKTLDTAVQTEIDESPNLPFPVGEKSIVWIEATTNQNDTKVEGRFSGVLHKNVDA